MFHKHALIFFFAGGGGAIYLVKCISPTAWALTIGTGIGVQSA